MNTPGFVDTWPHPFHRVTDGQTVEVFQLRPDLIAQCQAWAGGQVLIEDGAPTILLAGDAPLRDSLVGLGDFAVRDGSDVRAEPADGFYQRYRPGNPVGPT